MTARPMRVVYVAHAFMIGGAEEMVLNLVRRLPARFAPRVCCIVTAGPLGEEIRKTGVAFDVLGLNPGWRRPLDVARLREYLRAAEPDIVHTFLLTASLYGRLAALLARVPVIVGTEVNVYQRKRLHHAFAERLLMAGTNRVIVSAESVRDFYVKQIHADPAKVDVIYNAVDFSQAQPTMSRAAVRSALGVPLTAAVAGVIARLTEQKGHRFLFEALASRPELSDVHLLVVGGGELGGDLEHYAAALHLTPRVHFLGPRRDLGDLLAAMDVFVMPSLWEGLPLSMVLAMGAGLPVVATAVAGIPEVISDGRTGMLVPPGDSVALGAALALLFSDDALCARIGREGQASVLPRFGVEKYVESIVALYDRLLSTRSAATVSRQPSAVA